MATSTKNTPKDAKAQARSDAAKKAAQTRKANKLKKEQEAKALAEQQALAEQEQAELKAKAADKPEIKICDAICETLQMIRPGTENNERPEGYTYKECLEIVLEKVRPSKPNANTSLDCLRWYATKLRGEGVVLPYRPRNAPTPKVAVDPTA